MSLTADERQQFEQRIAYINDLIASPFFLGFMKTQANGEWLTGPPDVLREFLASIDFTQESDASPIKELGYMVLAEVVAAEVLRPEEDKSHVPKDLERIWAHAAYRHETCSDPTMTVQCVLLEGMHAFDEGRTEDALRHLELFDDLTRNAKLPHDQKYVAAMTDHFRNGDTTGARRAFEQRILDGFAVHFNEVMTAIGTKLNNMRAMCAEA